ncbi:MAG: hypothetical protein M3O25_06940 [Actinomycetota bacterium]|nr:hypothetical protein [Actinomycetota bacterium]
MAQLTLAKRASLDPPGGIRLSPSERVQAWLLTGPAGRVWSFGRDIASALPLLARHWAARLRRR